LLKYRAILDADNTPFDTHDRSALPVRRLWAYLIRREHLMQTFIRYIFRRPAGVLANTGVRGPIASVFAAPLRGDVLSESTTNGNNSGGGNGVDSPLKIIQREHDPITAFAVCHVKPGWVVLSTGRELQEMDISAVLHSVSPAGRSWMHDAADVDVQLAKAPAT
jgi:hypothetical protein